MFAYGNEEINYDQHLSFYGSIVSEDPVQQTTTKKEEEEEEEEGEKKKTPKE